MEALLLLDGAYVEDRHRALVEEGHNATHGGDVRGAAVHSDMGSEESPAVVELSDTERDTMEHKKIVERARALDARWPVSQLRKKLVVMASVLDGLYQRERAIPTATSASNQPLGRSSGLVVDPRRAAMGDPASPVSLKELPLPTQIALRMFFRMCQSLHDPTKIVANARLSVQVASKLPAILAAMPTCVLSPGLTETPAGFDEDTDVSSVFQQLFELFAALLGLPGSSACTDSALSTAAGTQNTRVCLTSNERATVITAYVALSLKWGRLRHLLTGVGLLLESGAELSAPHFELLAPLFEDLAAATAELPHSTLGTEDDSCGYLMSFGKGDHGKLGHGQCTHVSCQEGNCTENKAAPTMISATRDVQFRKIDSLSTHSIAVAATGELMSWGNGDKYRLGHGSTAKEYTPRTIDCLRVKGRVRDLACGLGHTLALMESGELYAWGNGSNGRLGIGDTSDRSTPTEVLLPAYTPTGDLQDGRGVNTDTAASPLRLRHIFCGASHSLAVSWDGRAFSWGKNNQGQCGHGNTNDQWTILEIESFRDDEEMEEEECVVHVAGGWEHTLFCTASGRVYACGCGYKDSRRAGIPPVLGHGDCDRRLKPSVVQGLLEIHEEIIKVACGWDHSLAVSASGRVYTWGSGTNGKLGHGDEESCDVPTLVRDMEGKQVKDAKAGCEHTVLLTHDHELWTFGQGDSGRLGHGDNHTRKRPTRVEIFAESGLKPVAIAVGDKYNLVLVDDGEGQCEHAEVDERGHALSGVNEKSAANGYQRRMLRNLSTGRHHELFGPNWLLSVATGEPTGPNCSPTTKDVADSPMHMIAADSFVPSRASDVVLFIMGHIDRIASRYLAAEREHPTGTPEVRGSAAQSKPQLVLLPFAVDTSLDATRALLGLLQWDWPFSCVAKEGVPILNDKAKTGGCGGLTFSTDQKMGVTLACLRILQLNLSRSLDCPSASFNSAGEMESLANRGSATLELSQLLECAHTLLDNMSELDGATIASKFQSSTSHNTTRTTDLDLASLGSAISQEAARALKVGFMQFYPSGPTRCRLLWEIAGANGDTTLPSMRTVILSSQLYEDSVMEKIFTHLHSKEYPQRPDATCHDSNNEDNDHRDSHSLSVLMFSLLKRSSAEASLRLDNESLTDFSRAPDCVLKLLHVMQTHSFSLIKQFINPNWHSNESCVAAGAANPFPKEAYSRILELLKFYVDALLSEALIILKKLHKASCQHEEVITWRLNGSFIQVLLPSAVECLIILFEHGEGKVEETSSDDGRSAGIQLDLVECVLPKLHPMLKVLDEVSWKMQSASDEDNQRREENLDWSRQHPVMLYCEPQHRNWFVELGDACAILCGRLSCQLLYPTKRSCSTTHCETPLDDIYLHILLEGHLLPEEFDRWASRDETIIRTKPISTILGWEGVGVFEVEDELLGGDGKIEKPGSSNSSLKPPRELSEDQGYLIQFISESSKMDLQIFTTWVITKVSRSEEHANVLGQRIATPDAQHLVKILSAVVVWHLNLVAELRECCRLYDSEHGQSMLADAARSDSKVLDVLWSMFAAVLHAVWSAPPTDNGSIGTTHCSNAIRNSQFLLQLHPSEELVGVSPRSGNGANCVYLSSIRARDSIAGLLEFITGQANLGDVRSSLALKCVDAMLLRTGVCVMHDLLRKLTTSSAKSCLLTEFVAAIFARFSRRNRSTVAGIQIAALPTDGVESHWGTKSPGKAIENLYVRVAKIVSSEESSFDLKLKALLVWTVPLTAIGLDTEAAVALIAKAGITSSLADLLLEETTLLDTHSRMNPLGYTKGFEDVKASHGATSDRYRWYSLPSLQTSKQEARIHTRLKALKALLFAQTPAQTVSLLAWETFCSVALQLRRSPVFDLHKPSMLLCASGSVANLHTAIDRESHTPRATAVSPRKRLTLPKKTVIATIEQSIEQISDALFVMLERVDGGLEGVRQSVKDLGSFLVPPAETTASESSLPRKPRNTLVFLLGKPVQISQSNKHVLNATKIHSVKGDAVHTEELGLSISFWLYVDHSGVASAPSPSETTPGEDLTSTESDLSRVPISVLAFGGGNGVDTNPKSPAVMNDGDTLNLVVHTHHETADHVFLQLLVKDDSTSWASALIEEKISSGHWTHIVFTFTTRTAEQLQVFVDGKQSAWHRGQHSEEGSVLFTPAFFQAASSWTQMTAGGVLYSGVVPHAGLSSNSNFLSAVARKSLSKHGHLGFAGIVDDVWIANEALPGEAVARFQKLGTVLFRLKLRSVIERHCINLLRLLCRLSFPGQSSYRKTEISDVPLSNRWVVLCARMLLHSCRDKEIAQVHISDLLRRALPAISPSSDLDIRAIGRVLFGNTTGTIPDTDDLASQYCLEDMIVVCDRQNAFNRQDDVFAMSRKQNELIYNIMEAQGMLSKTLVDRGRAKIRHSAEGMSCVSATVVETKRSLRFVAGVRLFQELYRTPSWNGVFDNLALSASTVFQSPAEVERALEPLAHSDGKLEDLVVWTSILGGFAERIIGDNHTFLQADSLAGSEVKFMAYPAPFSSVIEVAGANNAEAGFIQMLIAGILREDVQQVMSFSARNDLLAKYKDDATTVQAADLKVAVLVHLIVRVLRFFMAQLLREQHSAQADMPWHKFLERNPRMCDDLLRIASSSTTSRVTTMLGPDAEKALKLQRVRLLVRKVLRVDKDQSSFPTIQDLERLQWCLWGEMFESPKSDLKSVWWQRDCSSQNKVTLEIIVGGAELSELTVKALEHFPTVRLSKAHIFANSGLWFYEVTLLTDGLMQIGYVDGNFAANAVQGQGVGDHVNSWAYDGFRCKKWNVNSYDYGDNWRVDDVVGVLLDTDRMEISYFLNGKFLGVAFSALPIAASSQMFPAASLNVHQSAQFNFGDSSIGEGDAGTHPMTCFRYPPSLISKDDQNRLQPVILAIQCQPEVESDSVARSVGSSLPRRADDITADASTGSDSSDGDIDTEEPDRSVESSGITHGSNTGGIGGSHSNDRDDGIDDQRRRELAEGLTALGFPLEWATRCAAETSIPMDETGAVSWILEQMEKVALDVHPSISSSSPFEDEGMPDSNDDTANRWSMRMPLPDLVSTQLVEHLGVASTLTTSSHLLVSSQQACNHDPKLQSSNSDEQATAKPGVEDAGASLSVHQTFGSTDVNPFLIDEKENKHDEEVTEGIFPVGIRSNTEPSSVMAKLLLSDHSGLQKETKSNAPQDDRGEKNLAVNDRLPLCLAIDSGILVAYARQCLHLFMTRGVCGGDQRGVYEQLKGWLSSADASNSFLRFLRVALGFDRRDAIPDVDQLGSVESASGSPIRLQKAMVALLQFEMQQAISSVCDGSDSGNATPDRFPLFSILNASMKTQCERALALIASPESKKRAGKCTPSAMKLETSFLAWTAGIAFTQTETQRSCIGTIAESNEDNMAGFPQVAAASCYSIAFFEQLATIASHASGVFMPWKVVALKMMTRIIFSYRTDDTMVFQKLPAPADTDLAREDCTAWFSGPQHSFVAAAQLRNIGEVFALRYRRESNSRVFFSDFTCALFALLVQASEPLNRVSLVRCTQPPKKSSVIFQVSGYSSSHTTVSWGPPSVAKATAPIGKDTSGDGNSEEKTSTVEDAESAILSLKVNRIGPMFPGTGGNDAVETVPSRVLPSQGTYTIRNLLADTQYSFRLVPVHTLELHATTDSPHEDNDEPSADIDGAFPELFLQTPPEPLFELDREATGKNLVLLNRNLSATNTVNKKWHSVRASVAFEEGVHQWHVRLDACVSKNIFIGVCTAQASMENYIGSDAYGYGFLANKAMWHNKAKMYSYGEIFKQGDVIQVTLDCDAKTLSFSRNGQYLGIAATNLHVGSCRNNASGNVVGTGSESGCKWYPAFSMYNKDDRLTLIPPSAASIFGKQRGRPQNASVLERIEAMQDVLAYQKHVLAGKPPTGLLFKKAFEAFDSWSRGELVFRENSLGQIFGIDTSKAATEKFGLSTDDSVFTSRGQCTVLGECGHELWYEVGDGSNSALYGATSSDPELGSWSLSVCREMLASPDDFPVHHHRKYQLELTSPPIDKVFRAESLIQQLDTSARGTTTPNLSLESFVDSQSRWCDECIDILPADAQLMAQVSSIAVSRALSSPLLLSFSDISTAFMLENTVLKWNTHAHGVRSHTYEQMAQHAIARIGLLLYINRCLFNTIRLVLPNNVFATSLPCFRAVDSPQKPQESESIGTPSSTRGANVNDEAASITALISSPHWGLDDPSAFANIPELASRLLFSSQKEQLVNRDLRKTSTVTDISSPARELGKSSNDERNNDLPIMKVVHTPHPAVPFWELDSNHSKVKHQRISATAFSEASLFAQLSHQLAMQDGREWRREVAQPFEVIPISQTFRVVVEKTPSHGSNVEATTVADQEGQQLEDDDIGDQHPSSKQTAQYLQLLESAVREIQSPVFPLFAPVNPPRDAATPMPITSMLLQLDINANLLSSSVAKPPASRSKVLLWYFSFGQLLGIAWRGKLVLPLQFVVESFWEELVSPTPIGKEGNDSALQSQAETSARRVAIHSVRDGLFSIIPSRCVALSTGVAHELRARLSDLDVCYVANLRRHAIYSGSSGRQPHHDLFWDVAGAFTSVERRLLQQFINPNRRDASDQVKSPKEEDKARVFVLEIAEALADGRDNPDACYPVVVPVARHSSRLHLPAYSSTHALRQKLLLALTNAPFM